MLATYGSRFSDQWGGVPQKLMQRGWARGLVGFSEVEVERGLHALYSTKWPPTLPEFLILCRPPLDYEKSYYEAIEQSMRREQGEDRWSSPAIYWAATKISAELKTTPYKAIATRWAWMLDSAAEGVATGRLGAVPVRPTAITYNPNTRGTMPADFRDALAAMLNKTVSKGQ